jgi:uncharacterized membrane protein YqjE
MEADERIDADAPRVGRANGLAGAVADAADHARRMVRLEVELAVAELAEKARRLQAGILLLVVAAGLVLFGAAMAVATLAALFALFLPWWAALLVVTALLLVAAAAAAASGVRILRSSAPPVPEAAITEAKRTMSELSGIS